MKNLERIVSLLASSVLFVVGVCLVFSDLLRADLNELYEMFGAPFGTWFFLIAGLAHVLFAIDLLIPKWRFIGATGLVMLMFGALLIHVFLERDPRPAIGLLELDADRGGLFGIDYDMGGLRDLISYTPLPVTLAESGSTISGFTAVSERTLNVIGGSAGVVLMWLARPEPHGDIDEDGTDTADKDLVETGRDARTPV